MHRGNENKIALLWEQLKGQNVHIASLHKDKYKLYSRDINS